MWRILYVEDSRDSFDLLSFVLNEASDDFVVEGASSADQAMKMISSTPFDLYILDRYMPDTDGAELCRWIRQAGHSSPIVFYSGAVRDVDKVAAFDAGADHYLVKPTDLFRIKDIVRELLKDSRTAACARS